MQRTRLDLLAIANAFLPNPVPFVEDGNAENEICEWSRIMKAWELAAAEIPGLKSYFKGVDRVPAFPTKTCSRKFLQFLYSVSGTTMHWRTAWAFAKEVIVANDNNDMHRARTLSIRALPTIFAPSLA